MNAPLLLIGAAVLLQAGSNGFLSGRLDSAQSLLFSAIAFSLATLVFTVVAQVARRRPDGRPRSVRDIVQPMIAANVLTAVTFLGFYLSVAYVPAVLAVSVETSVSPLTIAVAGLLIGRRSRPADFVVGIVLVICSVALSLCLLDGSVHGLTTRRLGIGCGLALLAGIGAAGVALLSRRLGELDVSPVTVTANRFHLTYLAALALLALDPPELSGIRARLSVLVLVAIVAVVVPLYLLQIGLQRADPLAAMTLVSTMPGLTYLAQVAFGAPFDPRALGLTILITVIAVGYASASRVTPDRLVRQ